MPPGDHVDQDGRRCKTALSQNPAAANLTDEPEAVALRLDALAMTDQRQSQPHGEDARQVCSDRRLAEQSQSGVAFRNDGGQDALICIRSELGQSGIIQVDHGVGGKVTGQVSSIVAEQDPDALPTQAFAQQPGRSHHDVGDLLDLALYVLNDDIDVLTHGIHPFRKCRVP